MSNLGLAHPKQIDVAVPANLRCGRPAVTAPAAGDPDWAPLAFTFAGFWEIQPHWVEEHLRDVQVVDVREPDEFGDPWAIFPARCWRRSRASRNRRSISPASNRSSPSAAPAAARRRRR